MVYSGENGQYASLARSKRNGRETSIEYTYLGRVIDRERGIYQSRKYGVFTFDLKTCTRGVVRDDYVVPVKARKKTEKVGYDFGDSFFLHMLLTGNGIFDLVDSLDDDSDTLHALVLFYILSTMANCDAESWLDGNIAKYLYPECNLTGQRISEVLKRIGTREKEAMFQRAYIGYVRDNISSDTNILVDSSGLPNKVNIPMTSINVHNGKVSNEIRLVLVVQKSTGLPLFYMAVPGNIIDASTLKRVFLHLECLGINIESCIIDAGYSNGANLDLFYDDGKRLKAGFITRLKSNDGNLTSAVKENLRDLEDKENLVRFEDRYLFIIRKPVMVGTKKDKPAFLYLGLDIARMTDERRALLKKAKKDKLSIDEIYAAMEGEGLFAVLSGKDYGTEEILPAYYQRQAAEQIFDFAKNYTKLLPLRIHNEDTLRGHLLLSYIATIVVKLIHIGLQSEESVLGSRLTVMRNQKCTAYSTKIVTDTPTKQVNDVYRAFGISCPECISIVKGKAVIKTEAKKKARKGSSAEKAEGTADNPAGRPKESKNERTPEKPETEKTNPPAHRRPGRPKGSKNKPKNTETQA